jgi:hypothetical protein
MTTKTRISDSCCITLDGDREAEVTFTRVVEFDYDSRYGADADGNRGVPRWSFDEDPPENVKVSIEGSEAVSLSQLSEIDRGAIEAGLDDYISEDEPEAPEGSDEPDYGIEGEELHENR